MDNDKNLGFEKPGSQSGNEGSDGGLAPRARNRTVMLTPEVTGQVRARLAQDSSTVTPQPAIAGPSMATLSTSAPTSDGFMPLSSRGRPISESMARPLTPLEASRTQPFEGSRGEEVSAGAGLLRPGVPLSGTPVMMSPSSSHSAPPPQQVPQMQAAMDPNKMQVIYAKKAKVVGFLVSYDDNENGDICELRVGRVIVTSEVSGSGNFFLVPDSSVSPMHAILRISPTGEVQVLDQLSEHGTKIHRYGSNEEIELSGEKGNIEHGDVVKFGKRSFHVCMVQGLSE